MTSNKGKRTSQITMIPIDRINILNPRVRNQKVFQDITTNITRVGLKRPITVTPCRSGVADKDYDLICGQGRIEAFNACGQTHIPAFILDASEEQALIMSLVENLARRQHRAIDLLQGVDILQRQGYDARTIATKTGLTLDYIKGVLNLMERGEKRLLAAVEAGQMPLCLAIHVAENPENEQQALQEAYESKLLRGNRLLMAKRLIDMRRQRGKSLPDNSRTRKHDTDKPITASDVLKVYQREVDRKRLLTRKADMVANHMLFIIEAMRQLLQDNNFSTLLRAEILISFPKSLATLINEKGRFHA